MLATIRFEPIFGSPLLVGLIVAVLAALVLLLPAYGTLTAGRRLTLAALRLLAVLLLFLGMLRPTWYGTTTRPLSATLILMLDDSRSMRVTDAPDGKTRWAAQMEAVEQGLPELAALAKRMEVKTYAFAEKARPLAFDGKQDRFAGFPGRRPDRHWFVAGRTRSAASWANGWPP